MNGSVWVTLAIAIVGGLIAVVGQTILEMIRDGRKAEQLSHAIAGEVSVILQLIEARQYRKTINACIAAARAGNPLILKIRLHQKYFSVIEANLHSIGVLPAELPILIPRFLNVANAGIEDINGLAEGGYFDQMTAPELATLYEGLDQVIVEVIDTGQKIIELVATIYGSPHRRYPARVKVASVGHRVAGLIKRDKKALAAPAADRHPPTQ
ncbi:MAG: hypothetical protein ACYDBZ_16520 [Steroidobacteraceae bacterium]